LKTLIKIWASGMVDIFTNAEKQNVMNEIGMLLESLGIESEKNIEHWTERY
jgi:hypothetical protein